MEKVSFYLMQIIIETKDEGERFIDPTKSLFDCIKNTSFAHEGTYYDVEYENTNDYLWLYFNYGKSSPRNDKITNIETGEKKDNLRERDEAELLGQLFVCYVYETKVLYLSNTKKKRVIEHFLRDNLGSNVIISSFYKNAEDMIAILKKVDKIHFTHIKELFNQDSKERQALIDLTGTDAPASFTIEASYDAHKLGNFLRNLFRSREEYKISDLIICGRDESNFAFVYNSDSFCRKIEICCPKEETGLFTPENVQQSLLNKIQ